jgi:hypothetical protein
VRRLYVRGTPPPFPRGRVFLARPNPAVLPPITPPVTRFVLRPVTRRTPFAPGAQWAASLPPTVPVVLPPRAFVVRGANRPGLGTGRVILNRRSSLYASITPVTPPNPPRRPLLVPKAPPPPKVGRVFIGRVPSRLPANPGPAQFFARAFFPATFFAPTFFPGGDSLVGGEWIPRALLVRPALPRPRTGSVFLGRSPRVASLPVFARPNRFQITSQAFAPRPVGRVFVGQATRLGAFALPPSLKAALQVWWTANGLTASVGPLYSELAGAGKSQPFALVSSIDTDPNFNWSKSYYEWEDVQISVFGSGETDARTRGETVRDLLDALLGDPGVSSALAMAPGTVGSIRRFSGMPVTKCPGTNKDGGQTHMAVMKYRAFINRTRA